MYNPDINIYIQLCYLCSILVFIFKLLCETGVSVKEYQGKGAFTFRGSMIEAPLVKQAENIVGASEKLI